MKILVVGQGGREHALIWKLAGSAGISALFAAPGNFGTAQLATNLPFGPTDVLPLVDWAAAEGIDLTVIGPEAALAAGIVDAFQARGLRIFGPTREAARIETSKRWAKSFMQRHGIPTAAYLEFACPGDAERYVRSLGTDRYPLVVKADGLMSGKGVTIAATAAEAVEALRRLEDTAGDQPVVVEEFLEGYEASFLAICDGRTARPLALAHDYKRAYTGDQGPMTGGMGAFSPLGLPDTLIDRLMAQVIDPTIRGMAEEGTPYIGVLYAGLILTQAGPKVLEFNARFGDPETQVLLPRWQDDLAEVLIAAADSVLQDAPPFRWSTEAACAVVLASEGYPEAPRLGDALDGLAELPEEALVFHCGTRIGRDGEGHPESSGGRVLTLVGRGATLDQARAVAYRAARAVRMRGGWFREDVAELGLPPSELGTR